MNISKIIVSYQSESGTMLNWPLAGATNYLPCMLKGSNIKCNTSLTFSSNISAKFRFEKSNVFFFKEGQVTGGAKE